MDAATVKRRKQVQRSYPTLEAFMVDLPAERRDQYRRAVIERLGFDPLWDDRGISLTEITVLAGVQPGTGTKWRERTLSGQLSKPMPGPIRNSPPGKPLYKVMDIAAWLDWRHAWPPGAAARPDRRKAA